MLFGCVSCTSHIPRHVFKNENVDVEMTVRGAVSFKYCLCSHYLSGNWQKKSPLRSAQLSSAASAARAKKNRKKEEEGGGA